MQGQMPRSLFFLTSDIPDNEILDPTVSILKLIHFILLSIKKRMKKKLV